MEGVFRFLGICFLVRGGWVSCWMGSRSVWGRREVVGVGLEFFLGEGESGDWWEDVLVRFIFFSWWGWRWGWVDGYGFVLGDICFLV